MPTCQIIEGISFIEGVAISCTKKVKAFVKNDSFIDIAINKARASENATPKSMLVVLSTQAGYRVIVVNQDKTASMRMDTKECLRETGRDLIDFIEPLWREARIACRRINRSERGK